MAIKNVPPPVGAGTGNEFSAADHRMLPVLRLLDLVDRECAEKNSSDFEQVEVLTRAIRNELDAFLADLHTQQPQAAPDLFGVLINYQVLREQLNRAAAVANALGLHQTPDTHAYHLAQQLDAMLGRSDHLYKLDAYFGVDHNGETVEVNHG